MNNWSTFQSNLASQNNSYTPFIESIEGTAIVNQSSEVKILGKNFTSESEVICNTGTVSNVQKSPELITFDCLASSPGSALVEVKNGLLSSEDWSSQSTPVLIARNSLNLTNGWLDFRTVDPATLGTVFSHVNASLSTKTFVNSGYTLDATDGLKIGETGTTNSFSNYIQFNSFQFIDKNCKIEYIYKIVIDLSPPQPNRLNIGIGRSSTNNLMLHGVDNFGGQAGRKNHNNGLSPFWLTVSTFYSNTYFPVNSTLILKYVWDMTTQTFSVYNNINLSNFELGDLILSNPIGSLNNSDVSIRPVFQFYNPNSNSSVIAMKID